MDTQKRIKKLMEERGWTDYRLAKEARLSHSTVTNMFNRNNAPTLPTLEAVCRAFGITLAQFFAEGDEPTQLTEDQHILFSRWSPLTEEQKRLLLDLMKTMWNPVDSQTFRINGISFGGFILFYFALRGGSNWLKGFKLHFKNGSLFQSIKRKGSRQVIESAESLYFKRFSHICLERIVSKCGFTYPCTIWGW